VLLILAVLFVVVPIVELYFIIQVAHVIGGIETIALLVVESLIGAWLMKRQGMGALNRISRALDEHRMPGRELVDGVLILFAGALMLTPGFVTDVLGFLLLLPPTRAVVRRLLMRRFQQGRYGRLFSIGSVGSAGGRRVVGSFRTPGRPAGGDVFDTVGAERAERRPPAGSDRPELRP